MNTPTLKLSRTALADNLLPALLAIVLTTTLMVNAIQLRNCWQAGLDEATKVESVEYEPIEQTLQADAKLVVTSPKTASVGQLVEVSVNTGSSLKFVVKGVDPSNVRVLDHSVVFTSPVATTVNVFVAAMVGDALVVEHVAVQIGTPEARPLASTLKSDIAPLIEAVDSDDKLKELKEISAAFRQVATLIKDGAIDSTEDAVRVTKALVKKATATAGDAWRKVIDVIQVDTEKAADDGKLKTLEDHARHWEMISHALDPNP